MFSPSDGKVVLALSALAAASIGLGLLLSPPFGEVSTDVGALMEGSESRRLDLNRASLAELMELPGIGPVLAERIVRHRLVQGPFRSIEELLLVRGIGPRKLERLRAHLRICSTPSCE
jgi:competence protein ComEA